MLHRFSIKDYQTWYEKALDAKNAVSDLEEQVIKLKTAKIQLEIDVKADKLEQIETKYNKLQTKLDLRDSFSQLGSEKDYKTLNKYVSQQIKNLNEQNELVKQQQAIVKKGSESWYEYQSTIDSNNSSIQSLTKSMVENAQATTVGYILNRREYLGHTVLGKTTRDNFKTKRKRIANEDELLVFYNTHEAIIDQETYDKAQRMRKRVSPRRNSEKPAHRLSGLLYCADCGSRLAYINSKPKDGKIYDSNQAFRCSRYHNKYHSCTGYYIKASTIEMLIYQATKRVSQYVLKDEKEFVEQLKAQYELQCEKDNTDDKKELLEAKRRMMDLDDLIKGLYENFTLGRLPERQFNRLMTEYDTEQSSLEQRISELETATERISTKAVQIDKFVRLVKKYRDFEELTTPMLFH